MTAKVTDCKEILFSRKHLDCASSQTELLKRMVVAAIPFAGFYAPLKFPVSVVMGTLQVWNADHTSVIATGVAVAAFASTLFQHRAGVVVAALYDVALELKQMRRGDWEACFKSSIKVCNNLVYLMLLSRGGLELAICACALQAVVNLIQARDAFKSDRWIEGVANGLMASVRFRQSYDLHHMLTRNREIEAAIKRVFVGKLHEKWRFPSDHLPIGVEVGGVRIISWNVLNNAYMRWVTDQDSQGLKGSLITDLNIAVNEQGLTRRDLMIASMIQNMMLRGDVVALQECGEPFLQHLQGQLPSNWELIKSFKSRLDQEVVLYNKNRLNYRPQLSETSQTAYPSAPGRPLQNVYFSGPAGDLRLINAHIPGDPAQPGREEFAYYVRRQYEEGVMTVALGDHHFERDEMIAAFRKAGFSEFSLHSPWKTNIDPVTKEAKGIDHVFVVGEDPSRDLKPNEVLSGSALQETIGLLNPAS